MVRELTTRVGFLEQTVAQQGVMLASISVRLDHMAERVERIERRLDLTEEAPQ